MPRITASTYACNQNLRYWCTKHCIWFRSDLYSCESEKCYWSEVYSFQYWSYFSKIMDTFSIFLNITQASHWLYFDPYSYRTRINQPDFVLDIYSIIIYVYTDTSTSFIFRLQPLMLSNESHSRFIFSKINNCFFRITVDILSYRISTILKLNRVRKN